MEIGNLDILNIDVLAETSNQKSFNLWDVNASSYTHFISIFSQESAKGIEENL